MRVTFWHPLIRRSRLERFLRTQVESLKAQGRNEGAFVLHQLAENMRMGMSFGLPIIEESTE